MTDNTWAREKAREIAELIADNAATCSQRIELLDDPVVRECIVINAEEQVARALLSAHLAGWREGREAAEQCLGQFIKKVQGPELWDTDAEMPERKSAVLSNLYAAIGKVRAMPDPEEIVGGMVKEIAGWRYDAEADEFVDPNGARHKAKSLDELRAMPDPEEPRHD